MRDSKYVTMLDPFQIKYGKVMMALQSLGSLLIDVLWLAGTLISLGSATTTTIFFLTKDRVVVKISCDKKIKTMHPLQVPL